MQLEGLLTIDPASLEGPTPDATIRPDGLSCRLQAWGPGRWYPAAERDLELTLTEYADPGGQATYFHVANPEDQAFVHDELIHVDR